jgi:hypothetical protein
MRFESLLWTVLALFIIGGSALETDTVGVSTGAANYEATDGGGKWPPPLMDGGTSTTAPAPLTK